MVALGPVNIMHMTSDEVGCHFSEPLVVVKKSEVVFELDVTEVVPVSDPRVVFEVFLEADHLGFVRDVFEAAPRFDGEVDL